jgi:outer membrane receptor protein involved in Fe transport
VNLFGTPRPTIAAPEFEFNPIVFSSNPADGRLTRDFGLIAGFLQDEYKLDDHWTATAAIGYAQRAPTLTELYASGPFIGVLQQGTSRLIGDPNLKEEKLTQFDVGVRAEYDRFQLGVTGFYALVSDYITFDVNRKGFGLTQVVYTNTDRASLAGGEVFGVWDATDWLTPFGSLSYVQGTDLTASDRRRRNDLESSRRNDPVSLTRKPATEPLPQIPPLESRLGLRVHAPGRDPWWQVEFSARMVSGQDNVARSLDEFPTPGFTVFTVRGFLKVSDGVLVSAGVENFGDRNYREHLDPISGTLLNSGPLFRPGTNFFFNTQITY